MEIVFGDVSLGVAHNGTHYIFAYDKGGLDSLEKEGREYLYRVPYLSFWRATTDNDRGNGFSKRSAMWMGADLFSDVVSFEATIRTTHCWIPRFAMHAPCRLPSGIPHAPSRRPASR